MSRDNMVNNYISQVNDTRNVMNNMLSIISTQEENLSLLLRNNNVREPIPNRTTSRIFNIPRTSRPSTAMPRTPSFRVPRNTRTNNIRGIPTSNEVRNSTQTVRYQSISNPINTECPITHDTFQANSLVTQILHCGHIFSPDSISRWFERDHRCPVCRHDIRSRATNDSSNNEVEETNDNNLSDDILYEYIFHFPPTMTF